MALKLWHCAMSRSIRPLWTLEEMGLDFEIEVMPFPPRFMHAGYTEINPIGTVPFFSDSNDPENLVTMTESTGISQYLVDRYGPSNLAVAPTEAAYGDYLNWLHRSDATLTFPQTLVLRYTVLEPEETRLPKVADDYTKWFYARLRSVELALQDGREFLCADRFTIADIAIGYALYLADTLKLGEMVGREFTPQVRDYLDRLRDRPAFQRADAMDVGQAPTR